MMTVLVIIGMIIFSLSLSELITYGLPLSDSDWMDVLKESRSVRLNQYNQKIIYIGDLPFITTLPIGFFGKYHISGVGIIPHWSKMNPIIRNAYKQAIKEKYK